LCCEFFQKTLNTNPLTVDAKLQQPYNVSIPTLILSGENDPVTPREWAEELADTYTNSGGDVTLIRTGGGHGVLHAGWCDFSGMQAWVAHTQGTEVPDTRVAAEQRYCGY
jgi:Predicted esterase